MARTPAVGLSSAAGSPVGERARRNRAGGGRDGCANRQGSRASPPRKFELVSARLEHDARSDDRLWLQAASGALLDCGIRGAWNYFFPMGLLPVHHHAD